MIDASKIVSEPWLWPLLKWLLSPITAVITGYFTVRSALKRFYTEKWWEKRSDAYSSIMESLHHMREHAVNEREVEIDPDARMSADLKKKLADNVEAATAEIRLRRDIGSFLISDDAVETLDALLNDLRVALELGREEKFVEHYDARIAAADRALERIRKIAQRHLQIK